MEINLEGVILDPYGFIDVTDLVTESVDISDEWFLSEAAGATKKNIFQKLWQILKKICAVIRAKVSEVTAAFMSIFRTKKVDDKTLDQIAEFILGETNKEPSKHMQFRYENDHRITINYLANTVKKFAKEPAVAGHDKKDRPYQYAILLAFHLIKKPYLMDPVIEMLESIRANNGTSGISHERMSKALDAMWAGTSIGFRCTISMEEWTVLNDKIIRLNKAMEVIDDDSLGSVGIGGENGAVTSEWTVIMNELVRVTSFLQKGINSIGDGMRQIYTLDEKYHNQFNTMNFKETLPKFVKMCVESNVPGKYIYKAIGDICDITLNSDPRDPSKKYNLPQLKGNGRFVIFPSEGELANKVIKCSYNGLGSRGNRNEFVVWNKVKDIPDIANELYHIYDIGDKDNYIIVADRVKPIDSYSETDTWNKKMKQLCLDNNIGFIIRCNAGGFGEVNGRVICCDYGNVHRIDR